jgi:hypothetical protein
MRDCALSHRGAILRDPIDERVARATKSFAIERLRRICHWFDCRLFLQDGHDCGLPSSGGGSTRIDRARFIDARRA